MDEETIQLALDFGANTTLVRAVEVPFSSSDCEVSAEAVNELSRGISDTLVEVFGNQIAERLTPIETIQEVLKEEVIPTAEDFAKMRPVDRWRNRRFTEEPYRGPTPEEIEDAWSDPDNPPEEAALYYHRPLGEARVVYSIEDLSGFVDRILGEAPFSSRGLQNDVAMVAGVELERPDSFDVFSWRFLWTTMYNLMTQVYYLSQELPGYVGNRTERMEDLLHGYNLEEREHQLILDWFHNLQFPHPPAAVGVHRGTASITDGIDFVDPFYPEGSPEQLASVAEFLNRNEAQESIRIVEEEYLSMPIPEAPYPAPSSLTTTRELDNWNYLWSNFRPTMVYVRDMMNRYHSTTNSLKFNIIVKTIHNSIMYVPSDCQTIVWKWVSEYLMVHENYRDGNLSLAGVNNHIQEMLGFGAVSTSGGFTGDTVDWGSTGDSEIPQWHGWETGNTERQHHATINENLPLKKDLPKVGLNIEEEKEVWHNLWFNHVEMMQTIQYVIDDCTIDYKEKDLSKRVFKVTVEMKNRIRNILNSMAPDKLTKKEVTFIWRWVNELIVYVSNLKKPMPYRKLGPGIQDIKRFPREKRKERPFKVLTGRPV